MVWLKRSTPTDTGWLNVSAKLTNGWTGMLFVRRVGNLVFFRGKLNAAGATSAGAWSMPAGFNAPPLTHEGAYDYGAALAWTEETTPKIRRLNYYASRLSVIGYQASDVVLVADCYAVNSAWPATYPGVS